MEPAQFSTVTPLILSFPPWEKGRLNDPPSVQQRSLSQWERDRVRGVAPNYIALRHVIP